MHAVGLDGMGDVGPIVHQEERAGGVRERTDRLRRREELPADRRLQAELEEPRAAGEQRGRERRGWTPGVERIDDRVEGGEPEHDQRTGGRRTAMPSSVIFFRSVFRLMPSMSAAFTWLPPTRSSTISMSGRSTALMSVA